MPRFFFGDELGNLKTLQCSTSTAGQRGVKVQVATANSADKPRAVQALTVGQREDAPWLAALYSSGAGSCFSLQGDGSLNLTFEWSEQLAQKQKYIGLKVSQAASIYSCTSDGVLRYRSLPKDDSPSTCRLTHVPTRLHDWRISPSEDKFAYGGYEVDLSVWDTEKAFSMDSVQLQKSRNELFPAEIWRAKNVSNDSLGLRQPIWITCLTYLSSSTPNHDHLLTGTQSGDLRRYDTRAARRPVANWKGIGRTGGIRQIVAGLAEHEVFVSDNGGSLLAVDLRNGRPAYGYRGIAGAVASMAPSPNFLASVSLDRFARVHSTVPLLPQSAKKHDDKGEVLDKIFVNSIPTSIVWDGITDVSETADGDADQERIWERMRIIGTESHKADDASEREPKKRRTQ